MSIGDVASDIGKGLFAGLAGTAAMTVSSTLEMKLSGRGASQTPAQAAEAVLDIEPGDEATEARFSSLVHWGYGTGWGSIRGLLASAGLSGPGATAVHLGLVWGAEQDDLLGPERLGPGSSTVRRRPPRTFSTTPSTPHPPGWPTRTWTGTSFAKEARARVRGPRRHDPTPAGERQAGGGRGASSTKRKTRPASLR
jgi:hypothetical protein